MPKRNRMVLIASFILPKGALLILLWSTMMSFYQWSIISFAVNDQLLSDSARDITIFPFGFFILPAYLIIGLVADICVGRYKIIVVSIYSAFIGWIILCVSIYIENRLFHLTIFAVGFLLGTIGAAGIFSIAVPFNIDQMVGATADQLSTYIYWHCFGYPLGYSLTAISRCLIADKYQQSIYICVSGIAITTVMVTYYLLRHLLDTTPHLTNPIKLTVKVLNYARKNKYPRLRSALTYWEESAPSRLDLGKSKYGGPFTEEEVEDVKTFFRYVPLLVCIFGFTAIITVQPSLNVLSNADNKGRTSFSCLLNNKSIAYLSIAIVQIAYKVVLSKCCYKYVPSMRKRIGLGLCLLLPYTTVLVAMDIQNYNTDNNCSLEAIMYSDTSANYVLTSVSEIIWIIGSAVVLLASGELTVAQSPGHMRGLMVGIWYGTIGVFSLLSYAIYIPHRLIHSHCGLYYHVTVSVCILVTISVYGVLAKNYKLRARNQVVNIPHIVATVYERYIEQSQQYKQLNGGDDNATLVFE